jgi:tetratricopeptide (TPR) repeat protein
MLVGWKCAGQRTTSRAETVGLGGLFLYTGNPPDKGTMIELIFDVSTGDVRARAVVRHTRPGKGMGVQFVQMRPEDRARLNEFLKLQQAAPEAPSDHKSAAPVSAARPVTTVSEKPAEPILFEQELKQLLELAEKGTYYQLLGVTPDSPSSRIKKSFYALARKFHPDHHMERSEGQEALQELMEVVTQAYKTLGDDERRASYDKQLAASGTFGLHRDKTASQETIEACFNRATECLRARNFVGSIGWLRKCVDIAPDEAKYHAMLAHSLATVARYRNEAIEHFEKAIELDPWNPAVYFWFAELYEEMQLPWRARPLYSKILEISPGNTKARAHLARLDSKEKGEKSSPRISRLFGKKA